MHLASMADRILPRQSSPLTAKLQAHLGELDAVPNTSTELEPIEHANLQLALNTLQADAGAWEELGLSSDLANYGGVSLPLLIAGGWRGPGETARQFVDVRISATESIKCLRAGLVLTEHDGVAVVAMLYSDQHRGPVPKFKLEVAGATQEAADGFLAAIRDSMDANNVMRGKIVTFSFTE